MSKTKQTQINPSKEFIINFKIEKQGLREIINPIIEKNNLSEKEILEVCQIGKFIYNINKEIHIIEKPNPPKPDFIIKYMSKLIGLEHTRIFSKNAKNYNRIITILKYSEKIYRNMFPESNVHGIISLVDDKLEYKQNQKREIAIEIAKYVNNIENKIKTEKPKYIANIRTTPHSQVIFSYEEENWQNEYLTKERLNKEIKKKEIKLNVYHKDGNEIFEYWLVLFIGSLSSASFDLNEEENYETSSKFDRVFLMSDFDAKIVRVK